MSIQNIYFLGDIALTIFVFLTLFGTPSRGGETCTFTKSSTTVSVFCENSCCDNECCKDDSTDTTAIAIGVAVALALLLLLLLILLIVYCCYKRHKEKRGLSGGPVVVPMSDMRKGSLRDGSTSDYSSAMSITYDDRNKYVQTGEPYAKPTDFILFGRSYRWVVYPKSDHQKRIWFLQPKTKPAKGQEVQTDVSHPNNMVNTKATLEDEIQPPNSASQPKSVNKAPTPGSRLYDAFRAARDKNKEGYAPSWTPLAPWRHHTQVRSYAPRKVSAPLATTLPPSQANPSSEKGEVAYPTHKCRHHSELGSYKYDPDGNESPPEVYIRSKTSDLTHSH